MMLEVLPDVIIFDILTRLPAKSIGQFRCVSKPFNHLLCQTHFIKAHLNRIKQYPSRQSIFFISSDTYTFSLSNAHELFDEMTISAKKLEFKDNSETFLEDIPSCNGLALIRKYGGKVFVLNPITKEIRELPVSPYALNPCASCSTYGLGYDQVNDDYKVVALSCYVVDDEDAPACTEIFVNVYSIRNGAWKKAQNSPYVHFVGNGSSGVYVDGCLHWVARNTCNYVIAGFDLAEEKFEVPAPSAVDRQRFVVFNLVVLGGCLCMFLNIFERDIQVWVMKEYGVVESWTKFVLLDLEKADLWPVCMLGESELVVFKEKRTITQKLGTYNLDNKRLKVIQVNGITDYYHCGGTFMESLVSPFYN